MADTKLKPCPFCGLEPERFVTTRASVGYAWVDAIACRSCDVEIVARTVNGTAARRWNRRAKPKEAADG